MTTFCNFALIIEAGCAKAVIKPIFKIINITDRC